MLPKLTLSDTIPDMLVKMSGGNIGALTCLLEIVNKKDWYFNNFEPLAYIFRLDDMGLYGSQLYILWNDCCNRDLNHLELVLRNHQMGKLSLKVIKDNISMGRGKPFDNLVPLEELFPEETKGDSNHASH